MSKRGYISIYFGFCGVVVYFLGNGRQWWIYFGWWWVVLDIFWLVVGGGGWWWLVAVDIFWLLVVGSGGHILAAGGWWWVVAQFSLAHRNLCFRKQLFSETPPKLFCKKCVLNNFTRFLGKHLCQSLRPATLLKKKLRHRCFPFIKFLPAIASVF